MEWAPRLVTRSGIQTTGKRLVVPLPARERGGFTPAAPRPSSHRGRSARAHTGASSQITAAGDTCRNHQSPLGSCSPIRSLITCRERSPRWARLAGGRTIWRGINHAGRRWFGQGVVAGAGDGFMASPACPEAARKNCRSSGSGSRRTDAASGSKVRLPVGSWR